MDLEEGEIEPEDGEIHEEGGHVVSSIPRGFWKLPSSSCPQRRPDRFLRHKVRPPRRRWLRGGERAFQSRDSNLRKRSYDDDRNRYSSYSQHGGFDGRHGRNLPSFTEPEYQSRRTRENQHGPTSKFMEPIAGEEYYSRYAKNQSQGHLLRPAGHQEETRYDSDEYDFLIQRHQLIQRRLSTLQKQELSHGRSEEVRQRDEYNYQPSLEQQFNTRGGPSDGLYNKTPYLHSENRREFSEQDYQNEKRLIQNEERFVSSRSWLSNIDGEVTALTNEKMTPTFDTKWQDVVYDDEVRFPLRDEVLPPSRNRYPYSQHYQAEIELSTNEKQFIRSMSLENEYTSNKGTESDVISIRNTSQSVVHFTDGPVIHEKDMTSDSNTVEATNKPLQNSLASLDLKKKRKKGRIRKAKKMKRKVKALQQALIMSNKLEKRQYTALDVSSDQAYDDMTSLDSFISSCRMESGVPSTRQVNGKDFIDNYQHVPMDLGGYSSEDKTDSYVLGKENQINTVEPCPEKSEDEIDEQLLREQLLRSVATKRLKKAKELMAKNKLLESLPYSSKRHQRKKGKVKDLGDSHKNDASLSIETSTECAGEISREGSYPMGNEKSDLNTSSGESNISQTMNEKPRTFVPFKLKSNAKKIIKYSSSVNSDSSSAPPQSATDDQNSDTVIITSPQSSKGTVTVTLSATSGSSAEGNSAQKQVVSEVQVTPTILKDSWKKPAILSSNTQSKTPKITTAKGSIEAEPNKILKTASSEIKTLDDANRVRASNAVLNTGIVKATTKATPPRKQIKKIEVTSIQLPKHEPVVIQVGDESDTEDEADEPHASGYAEAFLEDIKGELQRVDSPVSLLDSPQRGNTQKSTADGDILTDDVLFGLQKVLQMSKSKVKVCSEEFESDRVRFSSLESDVEAKRQKIKEQETKIAKIFQQLLAARKMKKIFLNSLQDAEEKVDEFKQQLDRKHFRLQAVEREAIKGDHVLSLAKKELLKQRLRRMKEGEASTPPSDASPKMSDGDEISSGAEDREQTKKNRVICTYVRSINNRLNFLANNLSKVEGCIEPKTITRKRKSAEGVQTTMPSPRRKVKRPGSITERNHVQLSTEASLPTQQETESEKHRLIKLERELRTKIARFQQRFTTPRKETIASTAREQGSDQLSVKTIQSGSNTAKTSALVSLKAQSSQLQSGEGSASVNIHKEMPLKAQNAGVELKAGSGPGNSRTKISVRSQDTTVKSSTDSDTVNTQKTVTVRGQSTPVKTNIGSGAVNKQSALSIKAKVTTIKPSAQSDTFTTQTDVSVKGQGVAVNSRVTSDSVNTCSEVSVQPQSASMQSKSDVVNSESKASKQFNMINKLLENEEKTKQMRRIFNERLQMSDRIQTNSNSTIVDDQRTQPDSSNIQFSYKGPSKGAPVHGKVVEREDTSLMPAIAYSSPLAMFKSYRLCPFFRSKENLKLSSNTFSNKIHARVIICPFDLHGKCLDDSCKRQHASAVFTLTFKELLMDLLAYHSKKGKSAASSAVSESDSEYIDSFISQYQGRISEDEMCVLLVNEIRMSQKSLEASKGYHILFNKTVSDPDLEHRNAKVTQETEERLLGDRQQITQLKLYDVDVNKIKRDKQKHSVFKDIEVNESQETRYFAESYDCLQQLEEILQDQPQEAPLWIALSQFYQQQSKDESDNLEARGDNALNALARGLDKNPDSEELWQHYLSLFSKMKNYADIRSVCFKASQSTPSFKVNWFCLEMLRTYEDKKRLCFQMLEFFSSFSSNHETQGALTSHHLIETLLYLINMTVTCGKLKAALKYFNLVLQFEVSETISTLTAVRSKLTDCDKTYLWILYIYLSEFHEFPSVLFDSRKGGMSRIISTKTISIPTTKMQKSSGTLKKYFEEAMKNICNDSDTCTGPCDNLIKNYLQYGAMTGNVAELLQILDAVHHRSLMVADLCSSYFTVRSSFLTEDATICLGQELTADSSYLGQMVYTYCLWLGEPVMVKDVIVNYLLSKFGNSAESFLGGPQYTKILFKRLLGQTVDLLGKLPNAISHCDPESEEYLYCWLLYCLYLDVINESGKRCNEVVEAFNSAATSFTSRENRKKLWIHFFDYQLKYLHPNDEPGFSLLMETLNQALMSVPCSETLPYDRALSFDNYDFHNEVISACAQVIVDESLPEFYRDMLNLLPNNVELGAKVCQYELERGNVEQARKIYGSMLPIAPQYLDIWKVAISVEASKKCFKEVRWLYQEAVKVLPFCSSLWKEYTQFEIAYGKDASTKAATLKQIVTSALEYGVDLKDFVWKIMQ